MKEILEFMKQLEENELEREKERRNSRQQLVLKISRSIINSNLLVFPIPLFPLQS